MEVETTTYRITVNETAPPPSAPLPSPSILPPRRTAPVALADYENEHVCPHCGGRLAVRIAPITGQ